MPIEIHQIKVNDGIGKVQDVAVSIPSKELKEKYGSNKKMEKLKCQ